MSENRVSNLRNQNCCKAKSKRTGLQCNQPVMRGKAVCRFHGGKSTGPRTKEGRAKIRETHFIHGRYSKKSDEERLALRRHQKTLKVVQVMKESSEKIIEQFRAMEPYMEAYCHAQSKEEFGLINLFLFGGFNQMLKQNPVLRSLVKEMFEILYERQENNAFESFLYHMDVRMAVHLDIDIRHYLGLEPNERQELYIDQLCLKLNTIQEHIQTNNYTRPFL